MNNIIQHAINETKQVIPGYFENTCKMRLSGGTGSCYDKIMSIEDMELALMEADWQEATHPDVMLGCKAYKTTDIKSGRFGLVAIADLPDDAIIIASDPKGTGRVSMTVTGVKREEVEVTWIILGDENGHQVVFTFHPGEPVRPSMLTVSDCPDGKVLTKKEAMALGFDLAKVI